MISNLRLKSYLFFNRLRHDFRFRIENHLIKIIIPERFKRYVKSIKFVITLVGLFSAFIAFSSVIISFLFGLLLFTFVWLLEKFIFTYTAIYLPPLPTFRIEPEKWIGNAFGVMRTEDGSIEIPAIGLVFSDINYARKIHGLILAWSYNNFDDQDKNVTLSAIVENNDYHFFIYPSISRITINDFMSKFEERVKDLDPIGVPSFLFIFQVLRRHCDITNRSYFPTFRRRYQRGIPYIFKIYYGEDISNPQDIDDLHHFRFYNLKIKDRSELSRQDLEYDLLRIFN